jgi:hypothetical protein
MLAATALGIFLIPVFYVVVRRIFKSTVVTTPAPDAHDGRGQTV